MGEDVARDPECIFCKILEGDIPAYKLFEDEHTFAFMDINPLNDGHALIIPKDHHPNIFDTPTNVLAPLMETTQRIARAIQNSIAPDGINILQVHFHVLPRKNGDDAKLNWGLRPGDMDHISDLAQQIRVAIKD